MQQQEIDKIYMQRCLQLAANGLQNAKPNPMVGAVIVVGNRIIGEGYHAHCGEGHAEVNAFASVKAEDEALLKEATIYVSLEPCSHYGKTPPCADLIIQKGVKRVVCGCIDPFDKVQGRGIKKIQDAGIPVTVGVLEDECKAINKKFITFNTRHRPYIILKWAQTANGFIDDNFNPISISNTFTHILNHKLRAENEAILVGRITNKRDHPQLTVREWNGKNPQRIILSHQTDIDTILQQLYQEKKQSLIVEGGTKTLTNFIQRDLWDEIRVETNTKLVVKRGTIAPILPSPVIILNQQLFDGNTIITYAHQI
jgi:diaminohydroxyphosphoribosylaminopyrimidine deaminase/5-amino-6-(5-phosphoribosylamino)uracil reductase